MLKRITFDFKLNIKQRVKSLSSFLKKNLVTILVFSSCSIVSTFVTSFGVKDSSYALKESAAFSVAQIAKDNSFNRVHIETKLDFNPSDPQGNKKAFNNSYSSSHRAYLNYSSAAFQTRNNFYTVAVEDQVELNEETGEEEIKTVYSRLTCKLDELSFETAILTPPTNSEYDKKYTIDKYNEQGELVSMELYKHRMETLDLFMLGEPATKVDSANPIWVPDYTIQRMLDEAGIDKPLKSCIGMTGSIELSGLEIPVYLKNIIVTKEHKGDPHDMKDHTFTYNNIRFANFIEEIFGDYALLFYSPIFALKQTLACADFDSEYFKINSYMSNEMLSFCGPDSSSIVYSYQLNSETEEFDHKNNEPVSNMLNQYLDKAVNHQPNHFDGNIAMTILGILFFGGTIAYLILMITKNKIFYSKKKYCYKLLSYPLIPFVVMNLFSTIFILVFHSKTEFMAFSFSSFPIVALVYLIAASIATLIFVFKKEDSKNV